jgi:hypothetical protein
MTNNARNPKETTVHVEITELMHHITYQKSGLKSTRVSLTKDGTKLEKRHYKDKRRWA